MKYHSRYIQKPPLGVQIDWTHPLTKNLVGAWILNEGCGLVTHNLAGPLNNGNFHFGSAYPSWGAGANNSEAVVFNGANSGYIDCGVITSLNNIGQFSTFAVGNAANGATWICGRNGSNNNIGFTSTAGFIFFHADSLAGQDYQFATAPKGNFSVGMTYNGPLTATSRIVGYINGVIPTLTAGSNPPAVLGASTYQWQIGADTGNNRYTTGQINLSLVWAGRALGPFEHSWLNSNPWQIFKRRQINTFATFRYINPILSFYPPTGTTVGIGVVPYATFDQTIQTGTLFFGLKENGVTSVPTTTIYSGSLNEDVLLPNFPLNINTSYTATISGSVQSGPFVSSWIFYTSTAGFSSHKQYSIIIAEPGKFGVPQYNINLKIST